jgi:ribonuclease HI
MLEWRWALFRHQKRVLALTESGALFVEKRRVEIRFSLTDPRAYRAKPRNVRLLDEGAKLSFEALPPGVSPRTGALRRSPAHARVPRAPHLPGAPRAPRGNRGLGIVEIVEPGCWNVHADGSFGKGVAGAGVVIVTPEGELLERAVPLGASASSYEAEASALLEACALVPADARVVFFTDCVSVLDALASRSTLSREPRVMSDLRRALARLPHAELRHVKGHAGHPLNELADRLAGRARLLAMRGQG